MKQAIMPLTDYQNACDAIREKTGTNDLIKSGEMAEKIMGISGGGDDGSYNEGFEDGKKAEHDRFWDEYQENGKRTNYDGAFFGVGWTEKTFKPKHDIVPVTIGHTFRDSQLKCDLAQHLENIGVNLDFSKCALFYYTFYNADVERIGVIDGTKVTNYQNAFTNCTAKVIDKIIINSNAKFTADPFKMPNLEEIRFEGEIGQNGLNFQWSNNLSHDSLINIISVLKDYSTTQHIESGTWGGDTPCGIPSTYVFAEGKTLILSLNMNDRQIFDNESCITTEIDVDSVGKRLGVIYETDYWLDNNYTYNVMFYDSSENGPDDNFSMHHYKKHKTTGEIIKFGEDDSFEFNLYGKKGDGTHLITLGATNLLKLTDAEKVQATEKGWTLL